MRVVALALAVAMIGAWVGLVSVGTAQAHGGIGNVEPATCSTPAVPIMAENCFNHDNGF